MGTHLQIKLIVPRVGQPLCKTLFTNPSATNHHIAKMRVVVPLVILHITNLPLESSIHHTGRGIIMNHNGGMDTVVVPILIKCTKTFPLASLVHNYNGKGTTINHSGVQMHVVIMRSIHKLRIMVCQNLCLICLVKWKG